MLIYQSVGAPTIINIDDPQPYHEEGILSFEFEFVIGRDEVIDSINVSSIPHDFEYELIDVDFERRIGRFILIIPPDKYEDTSIFVTITDSRGLTSNVFEKIFNPSMAFPVIIIDSFYFDYIQQSDVIFVAEIIVPSALTVISTTVTSASGFDSMATFNPQDNKVYILTYVPETNEITSDTLTLTVTDSAGNTDSATRTYTPPYRMSQIYSGNTKVWDIRSGSNTVSTAYYEDKQIFKKFS